MNKIGITIPIRTRLPASAWIIAGSVALWSTVTTYLGEDFNPPHMKLAAAAQGVPQKGVPQGEDPPGAENGTEQLPGKQPNESLSEHLDRNQGVITPPPTGDAEIYTKAPNPNPGTTPVIPPPGTPGGNQSVQPE